VSDPDGNKVSLGWWLWDEAGSHAGELSLDELEGASTSFRVPRDARRGDQLQIVAEATVSAVVAAVHGASPASVSA
jgi:hypothetical protein